MNLVRIRSNGSWTRKLAIGSCLAIGLSAFGGGPAGATVVPATGSVTCGVAGDASLTPGVPASGQPATVHWTMEKIHQVPLASCDATGVNGGKSLITGGVLQVNLRLNQGASCDTLAASLSSLNKAVVMVKLTNTVTTSVTDPITGITTTTTQTSTSAAVHVKNVTAAPGSGTDVVLTGTAQQSASGNKPFGGETVAVTLHATPSVGDCATTPLTQVDLTGSTVSIHP
jgi:hypothetical protein